MRNETLKNLLLTASLISASALLTACGDTASNSSPANQAGGKVKAAEDALAKEQKDVTLAQNEVVTALGDELKDLEKQTAAKVEAVDEVLSSLDASLLSAPAASKTAFKEAMATYFKAQKTFQESFVAETRGYVEQLKMPVAPSQVFSFPALTQLIADQTSFLTTNSKPENMAKTLTEKKAAREKELKVLQDKVYDEAVKLKLSGISAPSATESAAIQRTLTENKDRLAAELRDLQARYDEVINQYRAAYTLHRDTMTRFAAEVEVIKQQLADYTSLLTPQEFAARLAGYMENDVFGTSVEVLPNFDEKFAVFFDTKLAALKTSSLTRDAFVTDMLAQLGDTISFNFISPATNEPTELTLTEYKTQLGAAAYERLIAGIKQNTLEVWGASNTRLDFFFKDLADAAAAAAAAAPAEALSSGAIKDLSSNVSLRQARTAATGLVDARAFNMKGVSGQSVELGLPLFVQLKGDVSSAKSTEAATGSVAYRLGNTVIGAIQGYANSGAGFGIDSRQLETSVVASHSFGSFFVEGQIGSVSATEVHNSNWSGLRSQVTLGLDTEFVSPFVQLTHRQLDRSGLDLNETTAYVGLDAEVAKLAADTYSIDTRLLAKAGYGSKAWSAGSKDLGSTTGFSGSVEWSASLNLNSGVTFSSNLALDTLAGSSAAVNVSLDR